MKSLLGIPFFYFLMLGIVSADPALVPNTTSVAPVSSPSSATSITLEQATKQVIGNNYTNRVLSAKTEEIDGHRAHVVKTLTPDGRIQQQTIDADTGVLLDINDGKSEIPKE